MERIEEREMMMKGVRRLIAIGAITGTIVGAVFGAITGVVVSTLLGVMTR